MRIRLNRVAFDLDKALTTIAFDTENPHDVYAYIQAAAARLVAPSFFSALHMFYCESANVVRICLWSGSSWVEDLPINQYLGRGMIVDLRRSMRVEQSDQSFRTGTVTYRRRGQRGRWAAFSPHECDFRVYASDDRPAYLPYAVVHAELWRKLDPTGAGANVV